ncbi:hypothetical protein GAYE_SCF54G6190 [Galdieria yellowstonensis]|uniref:TAFII28-like protein domain-containing protein n=1 Tax=Galdieria yellowstonensis TaxID=3028027 RepID=A0AAV9ILX3_9RHOD|nr:hypothetical protein GAYE_SCF54G6190 [Galdieria yellowstonensis]
MQVELREEDLLPEEQQEQLHVEEHPKPSPLVREPPETTKNADNEEESDAVADEEIVRLQKQKDRERFASLDEEEQERYEYYRMGDLDKNKVKKLVATANPALSMMQPDNPFIIAVKGLGKLYAGQLVEMAINIRNERGEQGAIRPVHLKEAYRRQQKAGKTPKYRKSFLTR